MLFDYFGYIVEKLCIYFFRKVRAYQVLNISIYSFIDKRMSLRVELKFC